MIEDLLKDCATVELAEAAQGFAAVGSEPRLEVLLALVRAGPEGLSVGEIQERLAVPASTLTHHLRFLVAAGLVVQEKQGRTIRNRADFDRISALAGYLLKECCADSKGGNS
jgi:ArsR family transcriptional regulator, arsenate/arsenite/antimonite-responsive transcriptional repressor